MERLKACGTGSCEGCGRQLGRGFEEAGEGEKVWGCAVGIVAKEGDFS